MNRKMIIYEEFMNQKGFQSLLLVIILLLAIGGSLYFFENALSEKVAPPEFSANQNLRKYQAPVHRSQIFYSGNKDYSLVVQYDNDGKGNVSCSKRTFDKNGQEIGTSDSSEFLRSMVCYNNQSLQLDGFKNFSGDNMVFNILGGDVDIFNIPSGKVDKITYDPGETHKDYYFMGADTDLKYMLFSQAGYPYIDQVRDYEGKEIFNIQPLLQIADNPKIESFYDPANHGILYLKSFDKKGYQFSYFDLKTWRMRDLRFISQRQNTLGRDCGGNYMYSETRKLVFIGGCMDVLDKDKNENGEIVLSL